jgi:hypothetical protein
MGHGTRRCCQFVMAISAATALIAVAGPTRADALYGQWDCGRIAPNTWCTLTESNDGGRTWHESVHTWDRVAASHGYAPYSYAINMCAKLTSPGYSVTYARSCAFSQHFSVFSDQLGRAPYPNTNTGMKAHVANGDNSFSATVAGAADAG